MNRPSVLLVGDANWPEFRQALEMLSERADLRVARTIDEAMQCVDEGMDEGAVTPEVIVIAQSRPGQYARQSIDRLRLVAPLARLVGLLGSWCEGEVLGGNPWPGAVRTYWHQWLPRCDQQLARILEDRCPTWGLPSTATEEERLLLLVDDPVPERQGLIVIHTPRYETAEVLSDACSDRGYSTVWFHPRKAARIEGAKAAIWEDASCLGREAERIGQLAQTIRPAPIIALLDFPRLEESEQALAAGAAAVVSKPFLLDDLFWCLDRVLGGPKRKE